MKSLGWTTHSADETLALGRRLGAVLQGGDVLGLAGPLGAGKTWLVKGLAAGYGVAGERVVNSPTYVIVNEYRGRGPMFHIDAYRLAAPGELEALGFAEMCSAGGVVVVEWADKVAELMPPGHVRIDLIPVAAEVRRLEPAAAGQEGRQLLRRLAEVSA